jgi:hypothetical protein
MFIMFTSPNAANFQLAPPIGAPPPLPPLT